MQVIIESWELIGIGTILASIIGLIVTLCHVHFFHKTNLPLGRKVKFVFLTDSGIYLMTILFGFWAFLDLGFKTALTLHILRIPLILLNIYAGIQLYRVYKQISNHKKRKG